MSEQNLKELAKQGDPQVIASIMNRSLHPKGIDAQVSRDNGNLDITLEGDEAPAKATLMKFIRNGMMNLETESIYTVRVYGRKRGEQYPEWTDEVVLKTPPDSFSLDDDLDAMPQDLIDNDDDYGGDGEEDNYDQNEDEEEEEGDEEEGSEAEVPPAKKKSLLLPILLALLVPIGVLAGLHLSGIFPLPFLSSSDPEVIPSPEATGSPINKPSPAAVASPKKATPKASPVTKSASPTSAAVKPSPSVAPKPASPATTPKPKPSPVATAPAPMANPWRDGVNSAVRAANLALTAKSKAEWNAVATEWQRAVNQMKAVPANSPNYQQAQNKAVEYGNNLNIAKQRAANSP